MLSQAFADQRASEAQDGPAESEADGYIAPVEQVPAAPPALAVPNTISPNKSVSLTLNADSLVISEEARRDESSRGCRCRSVCCCGLFAAHPAPRQRSIPLFDVLWAEVIPGHLAISYAVPTSTPDINASSLRYAVDQDQISTAEAWAELVLSKAYGKSQQRKRIKILINPFGGKGQAAKLYYKEVEPILSAARCQVDVETTTHQGHAAEIAEEVGVNAYDVIAPCSGDGLVNEVFNGLGRRENAREALTNVAVAHIPCGSGNAMSWNLYGTGSVSKAALCLVKGLRTPLDLVSITQDDRRQLSFLSQSFGIVAEADLGTDHLRWMGSARFTYGFLTRLIGQTVYPCDVAVKAEISEKSEIKAHYEMLSRGPPGGTPREQSFGKPGLPQLNYGSVTDELPPDWQLIPHEKLGNFYAGNMAFMSADANFFPACLPNDGLMDLIMINGDVSRKTAIQMLLAVGKGTLFDMSEVSVRKISGYRLIPRHKEGCISIDGERIPFEPFQAEVHKGLGTVLSRSGYKYEAWGVAPDPAPEI